MTEKQCISCNHLFISEKRDQCSWCMFKSTRTVYYCSTCDEPLYGDDMFKAIKGSYSCDKMENDKID